jgi:large subunit ribosomal protein L35
MPKNKMKTHKSGAKRYRMTASGKLVRGQGGRGHLNSKKSSARKRRLEGLIEVYPGNAVKIRLEIPYPQYIR